MRPKNVLAYISAKILNQQVKRSNDEEKLKCNSTEIDLDPMN